MSAAAELVLQGVREWLKLSGARAGLTDEQVIPGDDKGPRPPAPYLTVKVISSETPVGEDEPVVFLGDEVLVGAGAEGDVYEITVNEVDVEYTRAEGESDAQVATALAAAIEASGAWVVSAAVGTTVWVAALTGELVCETADSKLTLDEEVVVFQGMLLQRAATVSVQGFGTTAGAWMARAVEQLAQPAVMTLLDDAGLSISAIGGNGDASAFLDTSVEPRFLREFEVAYARRADPETAISLELAAVSVEIREYDGDPNPLTAEVEIEVT